MIYLLGPFKKALEPTCLEEGNVHLGCHAEYRVHGADCEVLLDKKKSRRKRKETWNLRIHLYTAD